jgi:L-amino acid N-acyltransferase YncA
MTITIREAQKSDCARMMELVNELALYEKAPNEVTVNFDHFVNSGFGEQPVWWAYVAEADAVVQGFALYYIRYSTWKGQRMYLEDIVVTEKMRGHGMGKLLLDKLVDVAKQKKYSGIVWQVLNWNEPAINFYKKFDGTQFDADWINCSINL